MHANVRLPQPSVFDPPSPPVAPANESRMGPLAGNAAKLMDILLLSLSFAIAVGAFVYADPPHAATLLDLKISVKHLVAAAFGWFVWGMCLWATGIYHGSKGRTMKRLYQQIFLGSTLCTAVAAFGLLPRFHGESLVRPLLLFWVGSSAMLLASRGARMWYLQQIKPKLREARRSIVVGSGPRAQMLALSLKTNPHYDYEVLGYVDSEAQPLADGTATYLIGGLHDLERIVMHEQVDEVFIALPMRSKYQEIESVLTICEAAGVQSQYLADVFPKTVTKQQVVEGEDGERILLRMVHWDYRRHIKRSVDVAGALFGLVFLSPLLALVALAIKLTSPGPIFFSQKRYGLNKRMFNMYKFRSMVPDAEAKQAALESQNESGGPIFKIKHDPRITPIGRLIRSTSIDELPQLLNVLLGHMSLVGPRPLPMRDVSRFSEASLMRRFSVKPGMTGLWQVSGRSNTSFSGWIMLDLHYIDHWSLEMDARILLRTFSVVVRRTGAS